MVGSSQLLGPFVVSIVGDPSLRDTGGASWKLEEGYVRSLPRLSRTIDDGIPLLVGLVAQPLQSVYLYA